MEMSHLNHVELQRWIKDHPPHETRHVVDSRGGSMCWRQFGAGEPLVLIHGGHGSWMHWAHNIDALAEKFTVWVPDLPGYGDSSTPDFGDFENLVAVTNESLNQLFGAETEISLIGFSFGGLVSANIAARRASVRRLALIGPGGHGGPRRPRGKLVNWKLASTDADLLEAMRHNLWVHMLYADAHIDPLAVGIHTHCCLHTRYRSRGHSMQGDLAQALDQYSGEILLIWGEQEVTATPEVLVDTLVNTHPGRRSYRIIPDAGHWVQYEAPAAVNTLLLEWFGGT
jgi:pimeloyl-ACP methyl ester carboxylesterase